MPLEIKAGDYAVLRSGKVADGQISANPSPKYPWKLDHLTYRPDGHYHLDGSPDSDDIVATFPTREAALKYVAPDPGMGDNHPDGPDLASVPQTVPEKEPIMKITDHESGDVYWLSGHDKTDAFSAFGQDVTVEFYGAEKTNDNS